jgi:molybdopterin-guanine dinucleotide biosynthesis protein A
MILDVAYDPEGEAEGEGTRGGRLEAVGNGLRRAGGQTLVLSVDMPLVTGVLINRLWQMVGGTEVGCLLMGSRGPEPFPGLYVPAMLAEIRAGRALRAGLERCLEVGLARALKTTAEFEACLANWNHPEDVIDAAF